MFDGILIESRGNISDGTESAMAGIIKHVKFLEKSLCIECIVICVTPVDSVLAPLIALIGVDNVSTRAFKRFAIVSDIKFAVAPVSSKARHLIS